MALVRWEPFRELAALQNEMGRWMGQLSGGATPGNEIAVEIEDNVLTVSGERERTSEHSGERFYRFERRYGTFARSVTLPPGVQEDSIRAEYRDGVLEIRIPKPEEQKPKRIKVGSGAAIEGTSTRKDK